MCAPHTVVEVADKYVQWIVVVLAGGDGDGRLVAAEAKWDEHAALAVRNFSSYHILNI